MRFGYAASISFPIGPEAALSDENPAVDSIRKSKSSRENHPHDDLPSFCPNPLQTPRASIVLPLMKAWVLCEILEGLRDCAATLNPTHYLFNVVNCEGFGARDNVHHLRNRNIVGVSCYTKIDRGGN